MSPLVEKSELDSYIFVNLKYSHNNAISSLPMRSYVGAVRTTDADSTINGLHDFAIQSGDPQNQFIIETMPNGVTGENVDIITIQMHLMQVIRNKMFE